MRSTSMVRTGGSSAPPQQRQGEERRGLCRAPSTSSWQPWTPVPQAEGRQQEAVAVPLGDSAFLPAPGRRLRHSSEPQHLKEKPFAFDLDDDSIRTSDV